MKYETNAKDDLISFLESVNVTETHTPGKGTALFDTTPGSIVYLYLRDGRNHAVTSTGIVIACELARQAVVKWLKGSGLNIWMFPEYVTDNGSTVVKVTADFDWPSSRFEWATDEVDHIGKCLTALVTRANEIDMIRKSSRATIGASNAGIPSTFGYQSRTPR